MGTKEVQKKLDLLLESDVENYLLVLTGKSIEEIRKARKEGTKLGLKETGAI